MDGKSSEHSSSQEETILNQLNFLSRTEEKKVSDSLHEEKTMLEISWSDEKSLVALFKTMLLSTIPEARYETLKTLGEGGMGVVQLVKDNLLGREIALKRVKIPSSSGKHLSDYQKMMLWRLNKEASITAILEHPNIVPLYEMQQKQDGELCFTMRKVEGQTLRDIFKAKREKKETTYDQRKLLEIYLKVCDAISYAHSKGIIHRDLKPENIMVGTFGEVYVMDWGIAKKEEDFDLDLQKKLEKKQTQMIERAHEIETIGGIGTEGYMPPEQEQNAFLATPQSDIYALGKILRECFTWLSPKEEFKQQIDIDKQKRNISAKFSGLEKKQTRFFEESIPEEILAIVEKATQREASLRYAQVKEMSQDIEWYQKNLQISVKKYSSLESLLKWYQRHQSQIRIVSVVVLVLGISFFLYMRWLDIQKVQKSIAFANLKMKEAEQIQSQSQQAQSQKIEKMLYALNALNSALLIKPKTEETEKSKWELGEKLIQLCCATSDYNLAIFVANDMKSLSRYSEERKSSLLAKVEFLRDQTANEHWKRFTELKEKFWNKSFEYGRGEREDAIFEISKMPEKKIFDALLQILNEATEYFQTERQEEKKTEFYTLMVEALGRLENPDAGPHLIRALEIMQDKFVSISKEQQKKEEIKIRYMCFLGEALANSKDYSQSRKFAQIRFSAETSALFVFQTEMTFRKLVKDLRSFDEEIRLNPHKTNAFIRRGLAKQAKGDLIGAILDFDEAIRLSPQIANSYLLRGTAKKENHDFEGALHDFNETIKLEPTLAGAYNNRGHLKQTNGDLAGALLDFTEGIRLNSGDVFIFYNNRGSVKQALNDFDGAIQDYTESISLNPNYASSYNNRASAKKEKKDYQGAILDYTEAIRLEPLTSLFYHNRGVVKELMKDVEGAILDYTEAIRLNPQDPNYYINRGLAKYSRKDLNGAISDFTESIRLNPKNATLYSLRGLTKEENGDLDGAINDFTLAIAFDPKLVSAYENRAYSKEARGDFDGAIADFTRALTFDSNNENLYDSRGCAKLYKKDFDGAIQDFDEAIRLNPKFANPYNNRASAKYSKKDFDGAISDYEETIRLNPNFLITYANCGDVHLAKGMKKEAKEYFKKFLELTKYLKDSEFQGIRRKILQNFPNLDKED